METNKCDCEIRRAPVTGERYVDHSSDCRQEWVVGFVDGGSTRITGRESWIRERLFGPDRWIPTGDGTEADPIRFISTDHVVVVKQYFEEPF